MLIVKIEPKETGMAFLFMYMDKLDYKNWQA